MQPYTYQKEECFSDLLTEEINSNETIVEDLVSMDFTEPDELIIRFENPLNATQKTELDSVVSNHVGSLEKNKGIRKLEVMAKTEMIVLRGFEYDGNMFGLTTEALVKWKWLDDWRDAFEWPKYIITNTGSLYSLEKINLDALLTAGMQTYDAVYSAEGGLLAQISGATTQTELDSVVDTRE